MRIKKHLKTFHVGTHLREFMNSISIETLDAEQRLSRNIKKYFESASKAENIELEELCIKIHHPHTIHLCRIDVRLREIQDNALPALLGLPLFSAKIIQQRVEEAISMYSQTKQIPRECMWIKLSYTRECVLMRIYDGKTCESEIALKELLKFFQL